MCTLHRLVCYYVVFLNINVLRGGGHLSVRLVGYVNPGGRGENTRPCDGRYIFTLSHCDHRFVICADKETGGNALDKCHFGRVETPSIPDQDTVSFSNNIRGLENPILFHVTSWPASGKFKLKVDVWDDDPNSKDEHVEFLYKHLVVRPSGSRHNYTAKQFMLHRRTRLTLELAVFCDPFFFGESCDNYCRHRNDSLGHFTCDSMGRKQCFKGWRGRSCRQIDYCADSPCQNNGTCLQGTDSYECSCPYGIVGRDCDVELCEDSYCKHGGICYIVGGDTNVCVCTSGWTGDTCQERLLSCDDVTCSNNGTCSMTGNKFSCHCADGWQGDGCLLDIDECQHSPCQGHSMCINTEGSYWCECLPGWSGTNCTESDNLCLHEECAKPRCFPSGGIYEPQCLDSWPGVICHLNTQIHCRNNTTCGEDGNGTSCVCDEVLSGDSKLRRGNGMTACLSNCSSHVQCEVTSDVDWTCKCGQQSCYLLLPEMCCSVENDTSVSFAVTLPNGSNESYFDQDHFMYLCSEINMAFTGSIKRSKESKTEYLDQEISVKVTFFNKTACAAWRQWVVTYCLPPLSGDDRLGVYDNVTDPALTDPGLLMDSNYDAINWYPLTALLAVPVFISIGCFVVLRRRLARNDACEVEEDEEEMGNVPATFHNILYAEMNN